MAYVFSQVAGVSMQTCLMNASGVHCTTASELDTLLATPGVGAVVTKSCTSLARRGNPEPRYYDTWVGSINSMGLPNCGSKYYLDFIRDRGLACQTPIWLSIAGQTTDETLVILMDALSSVRPPKLIEINLSCPNIEGHGQLGYDPDAVAERLTDITDCIQRMAATGSTAGVYAKLGLKLPPYLEQSHAQAVAEVINRFPMVRFVTCINSIANGMVVDPAADMAVIAPKGGLGGLGGMYVKPTGLANVCMMRQYLRRDIDIVGCGGVTCGRDVYDYLLCGASMVQVGTELARCGPGVFDRLRMELIEEMQKKGYVTIGELIGQLKKHDASV